MGRPGSDYIGVGVGVMLFRDGQVFLSQRGPQARNERGHWEFPGGQVSFGETLRDAICREMREEYGVEIALVEMLDTQDHILPTEGQHWVSTTFIGKLSAGEPVLLEPEKCAALGWFALDALPEPLSQVSLADVASYRTKYGTRSPW